MHRTCRECSGSACRIVFAVGISSDRLDLVGCNCKGGASQDTRMRRSPGPNMIDIKDELRNYSRLRYERSGLFVWDRCRDKRWNLLDQGCGGGFFSLASGGTEA